MKATYCSYFFLLVIKAITIITINREIIIIGLLKSKLSVSDVDSDKPKAINNLLSKLLS